MESALLSLNINEEGELGSESEWAVHPDMKLGMLNAKSPAHKD